MGKARKINGVSAYPSKHSQLVQPLAHLGGDGLGPGPHGCESRAACSAHSLSAWGSSASSGRGSSSPRIWTATWFQVGSRSGSASRGPYPSGDASASGPATAIGAGAGDIADSGIERKQDMHRQRSIRTVCRARGTGMHGTGPRPQARHASRWIREPGNAIALLGRTGKCWPHGPAPGPIFPEAWADGRKRNEGPRTPTEPSIHPTRTPQAPHVICKGSRASCPDWILVPRIPSDPQLQSVRHLSRMRRGERFQRRAAVSSATASG